MGHVGLIARCSKKEKLKMPRRNFHPRGLAQPNKTFMRAPMKVDASAVS
jgi:hypothetical protein